MSNKLIELLSCANKGSDYRLVGRKTFNDAQILEYYENQLREKLSLSSNARWDVALTIAWLVRSGAWAAYHNETHELYNKWDKDNPGAKSSQNPYYPIGGMWYQSNSIYLLTFLKEKFGLCRTTVYNYLEVVDTFATYIEERGKEPQYSINEEAKHYQFWQLIEMTSLTYQERLKVQPNWTREEIRAYKRSLREKNKGSIQPAELIEAEEKPISEAQQRFAKYSKDDLIDLVVNLEKEQSEVAEKYNALVDRVQPYAGDYDLAAKRELTNVIVKLLKSFDYEVQLCGRKQGFTAFAGVVAKHILENCSAKNEVPSVVPSNDVEDIEDKFAV